ncbi:hypothetical protein IQ254_05490 [Nodosilinea sp. LEGE 07088]|uniref:hypothetical protein n=1 Tax=Nodosilinea sp. LEGE 07088 TaxID=2777968 RepID=UPI0018822DA7|nr:hypothetical protein [Nodosilinea sp. LEGE 07088]MBE9136659.1 hypothetical protein [Nodosilinea sp. LEGE 07088]
MTQHLKRWESPRKQGRNTKGKGGTARQRQLQKRHQTWRKRLGSPSIQGQQNKDQQDQGEPSGSPFLGL